MNKLPPEYIAILEDLKKGRTVEEVIAEIDEAVKDFHPIAKIHWEAKKQKLLQK